MNQEIEEEVKSVQETNPQPSQNASNSRMEVQNPSLANPAQQINHALGSENS